MSRFGYVQVFCSKGHLQERSADEGMNFDNWGAHFDVHRILCKCCGAPGARANPVDTSNAFPIGYVDFSSFLIEEEKYHTCELKHMHKIKDAVYRIPTVEEIKNLRQT